MGQEEEEEVGVGGGVNPSMLIRGNLTRKCSLERLEESIPKSTTRFDSIGLNPRMENWLRFEAPETPPCLPASLPPCLPPSRP